MNHYEILGVDKSATKVEIKKAFKKKSQKLHPDKTGEAESFRELKIAFETLHDPQKRAVYDRGLSGGFNPRELQHVLDATVVRVVKTACTAATRNSFFTFNLVESMREVVNAEINQNEATLKSYIEVAETLEKGIKKIKGNKESILIKRLLTEQSQLNESIHSLRLQLTALDIVKAEAGKLSIEDPFDIPKLEKINIRPKIVDWNSIS